MQLRVVHDLRLLEDDATAGVESGGEEVERDVLQVLLQERGVGVVGGEGVEVGDEEVSVVVLLKVHPVMERAHVVAKVQATGGSHAGEDAGTGCGTWGRRAHCVSC
jgi:hypothetical protein